MLFESLAFRDMSFDIVFGAYILHHTNLQCSISETARVLKNSGVAIFIENFAFNPIFNFGRKYLTGRFYIPKYGTENEHPLTINDVKNIRKYFKKIEIRILN